MFCKNCGAILGENDSFCKQCGQAVTLNNSSNVQQTIDFTSNKDTSSYSNNENYSQYNNTPHNNMVLKIIILIVLAIIFWFIGFGLCNLIFSNKNSSNDEANNSNIGQNDSETKNNSSTINNVQSGKHYIITENGSKIYFELPNTLTIDTEVSDEESVYVEKINDEDESFGAWITEDYDSLDEYLEAVDYSVESKESREEYSNISVSDIKTTTVNGKKFSYRLLSYTLYSKNYTDAYIAYQIEDDSLYTVEIEGYNLINTEELNKLLTISISK